MVRELRRHSAFMHNLWCYTEKLSQRLRSEYDIREIDEDLYLAVLQEAKLAQSAA